MKKPGGWSQSLANFPNNISVVFLWTVLQALASYLPFFLVPPFFFSSFGIFPKKQAEEKRTQLQPARLSWPFLKAISTSKVGPVTSYKWSYNPKKVGL